MLRHFAGFKGNKLLPGWGYYCLVTLFTGYFTCKNLLAKRRVSCHKLMTICTFSGQMAWGQFSQEQFMKENGVVKWFNGAKGYGFIQRSTGEDVFVHFSAIQDNGYKTLNEGEGVTFECQQGPKGLNAANVERTV
jgi:CspA family cold shock protein